MSVKPFYISIENIDQLDEHLGLTTTQEETIMPNEIIDMKNTAILLEGLDEETIQVYVEMCGYEQYSVHNRKYLECVDVGCGFKVYSADELEHTTKLITLEKQTIYKVTSAKRKTVTLFGTEYYEDMVASMLSTMEGAKVPTNGGTLTPRAGSGTPPDKKLF
ncbi:hypothetical protein S14_19 [Shewanella sp. phage 1/4]|uniref:hypothetical protein n=1 Tax=Shewanella phage 1/4 TaxID=1458859 RepID=UPI0004F8ED50|nr:hypothetical protein S14_19 [Shewanella sp. phage 1/4]AHK11131.1 hypothetical protein S14_19 [Shewanella sp. phage 1/4]